MDDVELRATFNGGIGMVAVVAPDATSVAIEALASHGVPARLVGEVVSVEQAGGARYVEGPLEVVA
jgi:phosphoribosylformylglycinamidine cyclo-ligase